MTKAIGIFAIVVLCVLMLPVFIGVVGGVLGGFFGLIGAVIGAVFGLIGGLFGAIFGTIGSVFGWIFDWHRPFPVFHWNLVTVLALVLVIVLIARNKQTR